MIRRFLAVVLGAVPMVGLVLAAPAFAAAPSITSFTPGSGEVGTSVTLTGTGFAAGATVKFGGVASSVVTVSSSTKIVTTVPVGAVSGLLTATVAGLTATSSTAFTVLPSAAVVPHVGPPTTATTVTLSGFGAREAVDVYVDTTEVQLAVTTASGGLSVSVRMPSSATPGTHWITAVGRRSNAAAQAYFLVRTNWTQPSFDLTRSGANPYENVLTPTTVGKVTRVWRTPTIGSSQSTPAVVDGVTYATFGDGSIRAFTTATGAPRWTRATGGSTMFSSPTVVGTTLYVGSSDHKVYALNAATGAVLWTAATGDLVYGSVAVVGSTVYVGSYDHNIYALNAATGAVRWSFTTGSAVFATPAVVDGVVYVGSFDTFVYALNAATGAVIWQHAMGGLVLASAVVVDDVVYAASEGKDVLALRAGDGSVIWSATAAGVVDGTPAFDNGLLFVIDTSGEVQALDGGTGLARWVAFPGSAPTLRSPVTVAAGVVYVESNAVYALNEANGALLRTLASGSAYGGLAVADGAITVGDLNGGSLLRFALPASAAPSRPTSPARLHATIGV